MNKVTFKYAIGNFVITPFGQSGVISMAATDRSGLSYYVKTAQGSEWFDEDQLMPTEHVQPDKSWPRE